MDKDYVAAIDVALLLVHLQLIVSHDAKVVTAAFKRKEQV
jgi:hypothetical protein